MAVIDQIAQVNDRKSLIEFLNYLAKDFDENPDEWQNHIISDYLECVASWIKDWGDKYGLCQYSFASFFSSFSESL